MSDSSPSPGSQESPQAGGEVKRGGYASDKTMAEMPKAPKGPAPGEQHKEK
jgi:hypothetical protein